MKKSKNKVIRYFRDYFPFDVAKTIVFATASILWRPKRVFETEAAKKHVKGGAVVIMNHRGFMDPLLSLFALPYRRLHFVATKELFRNPVVGCLLRGCLCISIDRENFNLGTFREITGVLNREGVMVIFPEGHINETQDNVMDPFKSGMVLMSLRSGKPIVPVYARPQKHFWNRVVFCVGEPIHLREKYGPMPPMDKIEEISCLLQNKELELKNKIEL